jgi:hypothetical protein
MAYFFASTNRKLFELLDVIDENVHETQFVHEANEHIKA